MKRTWAGWVALLSVREPGTSLARFRIAMASFFDLEGPDYDLQSMRRAHNELRDFLQMRIENPIFTAEASEAYEYEYYYEYYECVEPNELDLAVWYLGDLYYYDEDGSYQAEIEQQEAKIQKLKDAGMTRTEGDVCY